MEKSDLFILEQYEYPFKFQYLNHVTMDCIRAGPTLGELSRRLRPQADKKKKPFKSSPQIIKNKAYRAHNQSYIKLLD